jgi:hypothetical protein
LLRGGTLARPVFAIKTFSLVETPQLDNPHFLNGFTCGLFDVLLASLNALPNRLNLRVRQSKFKKLGNFRAHDLSSVFESNIPSSSTSIPLKNFCASASLIITIVGFLTRFMPRFYHSDADRPYQTLADSAVFPHLYVSKQAHQRLVLRPSCAQVLSTGSVLESGRYFRRGDGQGIKYHRKWKLVGSMDHAEGAVCSVLPQLRAVIPFEGFFRSAA